MVFRRSVIASWFFIVATLSGQTVEELRAKLEAAEIDKAVMAERARNEHPTSSVLIALIGAIPALYAAYLTHLGNKMVKKGTELTQSLSAKSTARGEVLAGEATERLDKMTARNEALGCETTEQNALLSREHASIEATAAGNAADSTIQNEALARDIRGHEK